MAGTSPKLVSWDYKESFCPWKQGGGGHGVGVGDSRWISSHPQVPEPEDMAGGALWAPLGLQRNWFVDFVLIVIITNSESLAS